MRINKHTFQNQTTLKTAKLTVYGLLIFVLMYSCRKTDIKVSTQVNDLATVDAFLRLPNDADPLLVRVTSELRKKDAVAPFIKRLIAAAGVPQWGYSELKLSSSSNSELRIVINAVGMGQKSHNVQNSNDTTVLIPFVHDGVKRVNSFLAVHLSDSTQIGLFQGKDYSSFGSERADDKPTAKAIAMRCMLFDHAIFKRTIFRVIDKNLALTFSAGRDTSGLFEYKEDDTQVVPSKVKPNLIIIGQTVCVGGTWQMDPNADWNTYSHDHPPLINVGGDCTTNWYYFDDPLTQIPPLGSDPGSTAGGGGGDYNATPYDEANRHPDAWEASDEEGHYNARMDALESILADDNFSITPCDQLNIMPLDDGPNGFGLRFKRVAQKEVSAAIRARMDSIGRIDMSNMFIAMNVQSLSNAFGPVVNCDYFAVHITTLPTNVSAENLLDFFRKYTSNFIDPSLNISFSPYANMSFTDAVRFYSPFEQSIGTIVHLNMPNNGSVVLSDYYRSASPFKTRFTYSTINSPLDFAHPVSGNREFGIFANPNNNGYTFYTMGVDRTTDWMFGAYNFRNAAFEAADELWSNMQLKMAQYVNNNGGHATVYTPVKARPKWDKVEKYLKGQITFTLLKILLGC